MALMSSVPPLQLRLIVKYASHAYATITSLPPELSEKVPKLFDALKP